MDQIDSILGLVGVGGVSVFGVWFVLRLISGFQRDFTREYAARLTAQGAKLDEQDRRIDTLEHDLVLCMTERRAMRARLAQAGIDWQAADWGFTDERRS